MIDIERKKERTEEMIIISIFSLLSRIDSMIIIIIIIDCDIIHIIGYLVWVDYGTFAESILPYITVHYSVYPNGSSNNIINNKRNRNRKAG